MSERLTSSEVVTPIKQWVHEIEPSFNKAMINLAAVETSDRQVYMDAGYEVIDGDEVFTGSTYCGDASVAFARVLPVVFEDVQSCSLLGITFRRDILNHTIVKFEKNGIEVYVDPTYGQVKKTVNRIAVFSSDSFYDHYDAWNVVSRHDRPVSDEYTKELTLWVDDAHETSTGYLEGILRAKYTSEQLVRPRKTDVELMLDKILSGEIKVKSPEEVIESITKRWAGS